MKAYEDNEVLHFIIFLLDFGCVLFQLMYVGFASLIVSHRIVPYALPHCKPYNSAFIREKRKRYDLVFIFSYTLLPRRIAAIGGGGGGAAVVVFHFIRFRFY